MKSKVFYLCLVVVFLSFCSTPRKSSSVVDEQKPEIESSGFTSLLGDQLPIKELSNETRQSFEEKLRVAKANLDQFPDSLDLVIWYGRRLAYLGRHQEAIDVYADGLKKFPDSHRLRRHRGHRYITTRQLDLAISDYKEAAILSEDRPNNIEPDGLPNALGIALGNDKFNIWYHYGLALYLKGLYSEALEAYKQCMSFSNNDDLKAATSYWLYMTATKTQQNALADSTLDEISSSMEMIENKTYLDLLLLFKEELNVDDLINKSTNENGDLDATYGYGIGFYYLNKEEWRQADLIFEKTLLGPSWESFGYIASEAEIANK